MQCISSSSPLGQSEGAAVIAHTIAPVNNLGLVVFMLARLSINIAPTQALSLFHLDSQSTNAAVHDLCVLASDELYSR